MMCLETSRLKFCGLSQSAFSPWNYLLKSAHSHQFNMFNLIASLCDHDLGVISPLDFSIDKAHLSA